MLKEGRSWLDITSDNIDIENKNNECKVNKDTIADYVNPNGYIYPDEWEIFNEEFGDPIQSQIIDIMPFLKEETNILCNIYSGDIEDFFMKYINVLDNIDFDSTDEYTSTSSDEDFF